jgi:ribosomal protein S6E (S10)
MNGNPVMPELKKPEPGLKTVKSCQKKNKSGENRRKKVRGSLVYIVSSKPARAT